MPLFPRIFAVLTLSAASFSLTPPVQADPIITVAKVVGPIVINEFLSMGYNTNCREGAISRDTNKKDLFCMAFGAATGKAESERKADVTRRLKDLQASMAQIHTNLATMQASQDRLENAMRTALDRLDELPTQIANTSAIVNIRSAWDLQFAPMINGDEPFNENTTYTFAKQILFEDRIAAQMRVVHTSLFTPLSNQRSLLEMQYHRAANGVAPLHTADLMLPYRFMEAFMTEVLIEQARGEIMYSWAARIYADNCAARQEDCGRLALGIDAFQRATLRNLNAQLDHFNSLTESMVLSASFARSPQANFLHEDALEVFRALDLFTAAQQRGGFGLRGRVIAAGDSYAEDINIFTGLITAPAAKIAQVPSDHGAIDWWSRAGNSGAYTQLNFAPTWKIYRYSLENADAGAYNIRGAFQWVIRDGVIQTLDLSTGLPVAAGAQPEHTANFGSFVAIARAGGAYAVMQNAWNKKGNGGTASAPWVRVDNTFTREWKVSSGWPSLLNPTQTVAGTSTATVTRAPITYAAGGDVTMHVRLKNSEHISQTVLNGGVNADMREREMISMYTDFTRFLGSGDNTVVTGKTGIFLQEANNGLSWSKTLKTGSPAIERLIHPRTKSVKVTFKAQSPSTLTLQAGIDYTLKTSGLDATYLTYFAGVNIDHIYFTLD